MSATPRKKSPTARTLEELRKRGWPAQVVEKWLPSLRDGKVTPFGVRKDLFGCIDIVALDGRPGSLGVQACSATDQTRRAKKALEEPLLLKWLQAGNRFEVWGWREVWKDTSAKTKRRVWQERVLAIVIVGEVLQYDLRLPSDDSELGAQPAEAEPEPEQQSLLEG